MSAQEAQIEAMRFIESSIWLKYSRIGGRKYYPYFLLAYSTPLWVIQLFINVLLIDIFFYLCITINIIFYFLSINFSAIKKYLLQ